MARVSDEVVQQVLAANDIVDVVGSYFPLKRAGKDWRANCPFHQEKTPSFYVIPNKQSYHCFGCGAGGSALRFVMQYENLEFRAALKKLAERAGISLPEDGADDPESRQREQRRTRLLRVLDEASKFFHNQLIKSPAALVAREYWKSRGLTREVAVEWRIGYAPESMSVLAAWAKERKFTGRDLVDSGLAALKDSDNPKSGLYARFRHRLMFPIINDYGDVIAFSGRVLDPDAKTAKYVNSPETMLFTKGKVLFGLDRAKRPMHKEGFAIICEGQMDLIACAAAGFAHTVAPLGTALTPDHARVLKRHASKVVLCYDGDTAGQKAADRAFAELSAAGLPVMVAPMPPGEDPDSFIRTRGRDAFAAHIAAAAPYLDYFFQSRAAELESGDLAARTRIAREAAAALARVSDAILRETQLQQAAMRLTLDPELLRGEMRRELKRVDYSASQAVGGASSTEAVAESTPAPPGPVERIFLSLAALACTSNPARDCVQNARADSWSGLPGGGLLMRLLDAGIDAATSGAADAFLATLPQASEAGVRHAIRELQDVNPVESANEHLAALHRLLVRERRSEITARLREPGLEIQEIQRLNKELLDLTRQLKNTAPTQPPDASETQSSHREDQESDDPF